MGTLAQLNINIIETCATAKVTAIKSSQTALKYYIQTFWRVARGCGVSPGPQGTMGDQHTDT